MSTCIPSGHQLEEMFRSGLELILLAGGGGGTKPYVFTSEQLERDYDSQFGSVSGGPSRRAGNMEVGG